MIIAHVKRLSPVALLIETVNLAGPVFFALAVYASIHNALFGFGDAEVHTRVVGVAMVVAMALGLSMDLWICAKLFGRTPTSLRGLTQMTAIHFRVLLGAMALVIVPASIIANFSENYEHAVDITTRTGVIEPELARMMVVGITFAALALVMRTGSLMLARALAAAENLAAQPEEGGKSADANSESVSS